VGTSLCQIASSVPVSEYVQSRQVRKKRHEGRHFDKNNTWLKLKVRVERPLANVLQSHLVSVFQWPIKRAALHRSIESYRYCGVLIFQCCHREAIGLNSRKLFLLKRVIFINVWQTNKWSLINLFNF